MDNEIQNEIEKCVDIITRSSKFLNQLYSLGKNSQVKKSAGKMILMERKNISTMKTKLMLLGTTYEAAFQIQMNRKHLLNAQKITINSVKQMYSNTVIDERSIIFKDPHFPQ